MVWCVCVVVWGGGERGVEMRMYTRLRSRTLEVSNRRNEEQT